MTKYIITLLILAAVLPVAVAQTETPAVASTMPAAVQTTVPPCPAPAVLRKAAAKKAVVPAAAVAQAKFVWPVLGDPNAVMFGVLALLALVCAFLLGRVTAGGGYQHPVPQVLYVQPPPPPDPPRVGRP